MNHKITVLMPGEDFERFASYCESFGFKKSTLIARLIKEHLEKENFADQKRLLLTGMPQQSKAVGSSQ